MNAYAWFVLYVLFVVIALAGAAVIQEALDRRHNNQK